MSPRRGIASREMLAQLLHPARLHFEEQVDQLGE